MLNRFRLILAGLLVVVASGVVSYAVSAAVPNSLVAAGSTRYAFVTATDSVRTTSTSYGDLPGIATTIAIPPGKQGDVMVLFCGTVWTKSLAYIHAVIGGTTSRFIQLHEYSGTDNLISRCVNFAQNSVSAGTKTIKIQWRGDGSTPDVQMSYRNMIVIVNIH